MKRDDLIFELIEKEHQRQLKGIELNNDQRSITSIDRANTTNADIKAVLPSLGWSWWL